MQRRKRRRKKKKIGQTNKNGINNACSCEQENVQMLKILRDTKAYLINRNQN